MVTIRDVDEIGEGVQFQRIFQRWSGCALDEYNSGQKEEERKTQTQSFRLIHAYTKMQDDTHTQHSLSR